MFCKNCGANIDNDEYCCSKCGEKIDLPKKKKESLKKSFCVTCGAQLDASTKRCPECGTKVKKSSEGKSKVFLGLVCGLFLSLIGLIIPFVSYEANSSERKTFLIGWAIGLFCQFFVGFVGSYIMLGLQ